ncbi:hypothetical protein GGD66_002772 [Bradyrhizobium sp. CIR48]|uniref:hypothetical protein n=1 Tax=unclassified Bradyrhizobium TaxID=2631580 RepID=UPI0008E834BF|nr:MULTISPECIES: hypothetical protein [unclassified Bradyrhizobium]MBB4381230.1 hypothetical protein [Bradyrhizobium sp. SBR1B]MBB4424228.1 hypothetical protein [Bradyrhizobium sp. CIR48]SFM81885.1 hypothetical protein SAMN05216573_104482 [Bradyrhizobium sp. Rc3b]
MRSNDAIHLGLMLLALAAAYLMPFELLLLAYVVLGPAHYFTEISWLHDRSYYLPHRGIAAALAIIAVVAALIDNASWFGFAMWGALIACAMLAATTSAIESMLLFMTAIALSALMYSSGSSLAVIGILIPTLIHVSLFTLIFMVLGAHRSGSRVQAALVAVYLVAIATILLLPPTAEIRIASFARVGQDYFGNVGPALSRLFGVPGLVLDTRLTSLLAFVYTYHYLNWFIKADVIRWTAVPKARLAAMAAASAASTALYFYDYAFGFTFLLALSLIHILLEFPLDALALRQLGAAAQGALRARYAAPVAATATRPRPTGTRGSKRPPRSR